MTTPLTRDDLLSQVVQWPHEIRDVRPDGRVLNSVLFTPPYAAAPAYAPLEFPDGPWIRQLRRLGGEWVIIGGRNEDGSFWQQEGWEG